MQANDVSLDEVMEATADALDVGLLQFSNGATIGTGGFIETPNQRLGVQHVLPIITPDDLAQVTIARARRHRRCASATWPTWSRTTSR